MAYQDSIRVVNLLIRDHVIHHPCDDSNVSPASLAKARVAAKFEEPDSTSATLRRKDAWLRWIKSDGDLGPRGLLGPHWAKARLLVKDFLRGFRLGELTFTDGSSFIPLGNRTSLACKLTCQWTITHDCFDLFAKMSYWHRALKHSVKRRFTSYCRKHHLNERQINRILYNKFRENPEFAYIIYCIKLEAVVVFVQGNRWSTVPKNNLKDRSICLEPLCNMLVQRAIGLGIRNSLKRNLGIDLDVLADEHRRRISDAKCATIDLSDCSDTISMWLTRYLIPSHILKYIEASRSDMTLGPDGMYYIINKVSSMGNGFTFDLMTLILLSLTRSIDATSSVFGDDIICQNQHADCVVSNLKLAGFLPNASKTLIRSSYRESCGAHYIDGYGYVSCFDMKWIHTPHDLIVCMNKIAILSHIYGQPYDSLLEKIWSCVPHVLLGVTVQRLTVDTNKPPAYELDSYVRYGPIQYKNRPSRNKLKVIRSWCKSTHRYGDISIAVGFRSTINPSPDKLRSSQWALYYQYIASGRRSPFICKPAYKSSLVARIDEEQIGFIGSGSRKGAAK